MTILDRFERGMLWSAWCIIGGILLIDMFQNCLLGTDCVRWGDSTLGSWIFAFLQWLLYSAPAFLTFVWVTFTVVVVVRARLHA